jgi:5-methylcytosine-specific restriction enzyme subunit McrC
MQIPIQNIYYLLCYAWNKLDESDIVNVKAISTTELIDLFAKILINSTARLLKQGLDRNYVEHEYIVNGIKGKLNLSASVKQNILPVNKTICLYDEFDYNIVHNQILKTTISKLLRVNNLDKDLKNELRQLFQKMPPISEIKIRNSHFKQIRLHRNNYHYDFVLKVCQIINENLFIDESSGNYKFKDFTRNDKAMARLFEEFVRNFYKIEQSYFEVKRDNIEWNLESESEEDLQREEDLRMLPIMQTDISLHLRHPLTRKITRKIIIDTKYYKDAFKTRFTQEKFNSAHLYQLFSYLKNQESDSEITKTCEGILLYPAVGTGFKFCYRYENHQIIIMAINLNQDWYNIKRDLLEIISMTDE